MEDVDAFVLYCHALLGEGGTVTISPELVVSVSHPLFTDEDVTDLDKLAGLACVGGMFYVVQ